MTSNTNDSTFEEMDDQLKHLYDYTKFHIGMYTTLIAIIVGAFSSSKFLTEYMALGPWVLAGLVGYVLAGMCGGLIASSIPGFIRYDKFMRQEISPWDLLRKSLTAKTFTHLEHTFFWFGTTSVVIGTVKEVVLPKYQVWSYLEFMMLGIGVIAFLILVLFYDKKQPRNNLSDKK